MDDGFYNNITMYFLQWLNFYSYAGLVYVLFRDVSYAAAAKKALDGEYYNERLIKATYIVRNAATQTFFCYFYFESQ